MYHYSRVFILLIALIWVGCDSTHKLTGTNYVDIESQEAPPVRTNYPAAVIEDAGWNDITTELKGRDDLEEFRAWLSSAPLYPGYLFMIKKDDKRNVEQEAILYWERDTTDTQDYSNVNVRKYLQGTCTEFHVVENYGYCYPEYIEENKNDWRSIYATIESRGFWQMPEGIQAEATEKNWQMYAQMRLGNYYRDFTHQNPHAYSDTQLRNQVMNLSAALKRLKGRFEQSTNTNTYRGVTNGVSFTLCDSSEVWEFKGELDRLLANEGMKTLVNTEKEEILYYIGVKGRVDNIWFNEWATGEFDRELYPIEINSIQTVSEIKCPDNLTDF